MFLYFLVFLTSLRFYKYAVEVNIYLMSILTTRMSFDTYRIHFSGLLLLISSCVGIWSYYYIDGERHYKNFSLLLIIFITRILLLILFSNLYMTLIGWDGLGVTSFLLVVYYKNRKRLSSGILTALTNRIGDSFFLCFLGLFSWSTGTLPLFFLFLLCMTKSAQFPFSSWLPAAMAAPTPVRALVHSSTLVTAGIYLLIRYLYVDGGMMITIGSITALLAGLTACAESDLKKVVAYRTLSQLGVMMVAIGAHEKSFCFFHLLTHACFKALLFLCVGVYIHTIYGDQEFRSLNNFISQLRSIFCSVSILSLMGFLFISGFYRKESILEGIITGSCSSCTIVIFLMAIGLTSCYSAKVVSGVILMGTFASPCSHTSSQSQHLKIPLVLLGSMSIRYGRNIELYAAPITLVQSITDKLLPLLYIQLGLLLGYGRSRLVNPFPSSLFFLSPSVNSLARFSVNVRQTYHIDKGWLHSTSLVLRLLPPLHLLSSSYMALSTLVVLLFILW